MGFPTLGIVDGVWSSLQAMKPFESWALKKMYLEYGLDAEKADKRRLAKARSAWRIVHELQQSQSQSQSVILASSIPVCVLVTPTHATTFQSQDSSPQSLST